MVRTLWPSLLATSRQHPRVPHSEEGKNYRAVHALAGRHQWLCLVGQTSEKKSWCSVFYARHCTVVDSFFSRLKIDNPIESEAEWVTCPSGWARRRAALSPSTVASLPSYRHEAILFTSHQYLIYRTTCVGITSSFRRSSRFKWIESGLPKLRVEVGCYFIRFS